MYSSPMEQPRRVSRFKRQVERPKPLQLEEKEGQLDKFGMISGFDQEPIPSAKVSTAHPVISLPEEYEIQPEQWPTTPEHVGRRVMCSFVDDASETSTNCEYSSLPSSAGEASFEAFDRGVVQSQTLTYLLQPIVVVVQQLPPPVIYVPHFSHPCIPAPSEPAPGSKELPSMGSALHAQRQCKPCSFMHKDKVCENGAMCPFCHLCEAGEKKKRKKEKKAARKQRYAQCAPWPSRTVEFSHSSNLTD